MPEFTPANVRASITGVDVTHDTTYGGCCEHHDRTARVICDTRPTED